MSLFQPPGDRQSSTRARRACARPVGLDPDARRCSPCSRSARCSSGPRPRRATRSPTATPGVPAQAAGQHRDRRRAGDAGAATDHRWVRILAPLVYAASVIGLVLVLVDGLDDQRVALVARCSPGCRSSRRSSPSSRWSLGMALLVAERPRALAEPRDRRRSTCSAMLAVAAIPAPLILLQPDLGTMLVLACDRLRDHRGLRAHRSAGSWACSWPRSDAACGTGDPASSQDYQIDRFTAFANPSLDPQGIGYNAEQARIAIGNGGRLRPGAVPRIADPDRLRARAAHRLHLHRRGGGARALGAGGADRCCSRASLWRGIRIAAQRRDVFGRLAATGVACWFAFQSFENIGMSWASCRSPVYPCLSSPTAVRDVRRP